MFLRKVVRLCQSGIQRQKVLFHAGKFIKYIDVDPYKIKRPIYSFAAGPAPLPYPVMLNVKDQFINYKGTEEGVIEISHRSDEFSAIIYRCKSYLTKLLSVPKNYKIIFTQGGATFQYFNIPKNLLGDNQHANYLISGIWSCKAFSEGSKFITNAHKVNQGGETTVDGLKCLPQQKELDINKKGGYLYYVDNETIDGIEFPYVPKPPKGMNLVCDMTSNMASRHFNIKKFGMVFASAQKNLGPAGVTVLIIKEDILKKRKDIPEVSDYQKLIDTNSLLHTGPTFPIFIVKEFTKFLVHTGGMKLWEQMNADKAQMLYQIIDESKGFYSNKVFAPHRSRMNVTFSCDNDPGLDFLFLREAQTQKLVDLRGYRGNGVRASIYNGVAYNAVVKLRDFMIWFKKNYQ